MQASTKGEKEKDVESMADFVVDMVVDTEEVAEAVCNTLIGGWIYCRWYVGWYEEKIAFWWGVQDVQRLAEVKGKCRALKRNKESGWEMVLIISEWSVYISTQSQNNHKMIKVRER